MSIMVELQTEALKGFKLVSVPMNARAQAVHAQTGLDQTSLLQQARAFAQAALVEAGKQVQATADKLKTEATLAAQSIQAVIGGTGSAQDMARAANILTTVATATGSVLGAVQDGQGHLIPDRLAATLPAVLNAAMPGVSVADCQRAMTVALHLLRVLKKPSLSGALRLVSTLRRGARLSSTVGEFLLSGVLSYVGGEAFDLSRFLPGALKAAAKDYKARAVTLQEEAQQQ